MRIFGVRIRIHPTFIWLLIIFYLIDGPQTVLWLLVVFTFVVLHELSHSLVARAHGIPVRDITLLPIGGMARMGAMPEDPRTEFLISIAGPALNFAIAGAIYALAVASDLPLITAEVIREGGAEFRVESPSFLGMLLIVNLALGIFNLLPAFPMDGGRLLRACLARKRGYLDATLIAARVGRWIAALMALFGFARVFRGDWGGLWLVFIAVFIYVSGKSEEMSVVARHATRGLWQLFGYGGRGPAEFEVPPFADGPGRPERSDVIDVEGTVTSSSDESPADGLRRLAEEAESHLGD